MMVFFFLATFVASCSGLSVSPSSTWHRAAPRRIAAPRCSIEPPPDLDTVCDEARQSLREALLGGKRGLTVEASMQALDVTSRAYDPAVLSRFSLEVAKALTVIEGQLLVLLPGMAAVTSARSLIDDESVWPEESRERLSVSSLATQGGPKEGEAPPAAVVLVGLTATDSSDDMTMRDARAWLRASGVAVCVNAQLRTPPIEMAKFEAAYCLVTYTVARSDKTREDADLFQTDAGTAALMRRYPSKWRVLLDIANTKAWDEIAELPRRPSMDDLNALLLPRIERHQAALDSVEGALNGVGAISGGVSGGGGGGLSGGSGASGGARGGSVAEASTSSLPDGTSGAQQDAQQDASGAVSLRWDAIQAPGAFGPMAMYGAIALHRMRCLGAEARVDRESDAAGVHVVLPAVASDGAAAWESGFGKLKGGLLGSCHVIPDGRAEGVAAIEQLALHAEATEAEAEALLARAVREAREAAQATILLEV